MKTKYITSFITAFAALLFCTSPATYAGISRGGESNTNQGVDALHNNTSGNNNSAFGYQTLYSNTTGNFNAAVGSQALFSSQTADANTAIGFQALYNNVAGSSSSDPNVFAQGSTAVGYQALYSNTTATNETAFGFQALYNNTTGFNNNAFGSLALLSNTTGQRNNAFGGSTLLSNTTGDSNSGFGNVALFLNTTGSWNTANGRRALFLNETGNLNIGLGYAGGYRTSGDNNIDIGNVGVDGESNTIRIGQSVPVVPNRPDGVLLPAHTDTYIAGIFGSSTLTPGMPVYVDSNGKLGTLPSSERFKQDVKPMNRASEEIVSLKPVTFRYKPEVMKDAAPQFGLVAEDVAKVDPDLVVPDGKGKIQSVRYEAVNAMLLNEFLKEHRQVQEQQKQIDKLTAEVKEQAALIQKVNDKIEILRPVPQVVANDR